MARAKLICKSVEVLCGHCGETLPEPRTGSLFWVLTEITDLMTVTCGECGHGYIGKGDEQPIEGIFYSDSDSHIDAMCNLAFLSPDFPR